MATDDLAMVLASLEGGLPLAKLNHDIRALEFALDATLTHIETLLDT